MYILWAFGIFYCHLVHFKGIRQFRGNLVYFLPFWYIVSWNIWQPCVEAGRRGDICPSLKQSCQMVHLFDYQKSQFGYVLEGEGIKYTLAGFDHTTHSSSLLRWHEEEQTFCCPVPSAGNLRQRSLFHVACSPLGVNVGPCETNFGPGVKLASRAFVEPLVYARNITPGGQNLPLRACIYVTTETNFTV
jgi:hypothetical protein